MKKTIVAVLSFAVAMGPAFGANSYYVVPPGTPGVTPTPPYSSWETASTNIQEAVDLAGSKNEGNVVRVRSGTYRISSQIEITKHPITLVSDDGNGKTDRNGTILHGDATSLTNRILYVFNQYNSKTPTVVDGFTITGGCCEYGGGVYINSQAFGENISRIQNCLITGNTATKGGGGMSVNSALVSNCVIRGNSVRSVDGAVYGGGVYLAGGAVGRAYQDPTFVDTVISGNSVCSENGKAYGGGIGSAVWNYFAYNCRIEGNRALGANPQGGAAYTDWTHCCNGCVFSDNACLGNDGITPAGQMGVLWGKLYATNCVFSGNVARQHGVTSSSRTLVHCKITGNKSVAGNVLGTGLLSDCHVDGNEAPGVIVVTTTGTNCLFTGNVATNVIVEIASKGRLVDSVFTNNAVLTKSDGHGGVRLKEDAVATGCLFTGNRGVMLYGDNASRTATNCILRQNLCGHYGLVCRIALVDSEVTGNLQGTGGSAILSASMLDRCLVASNTATIRNAGIVNVASIQESEIIGNATLNGCVVTTTRIEGTVVTNNAMEEANNSDACVRVWPRPDRPALVRNCLVADNAGRGLCSYQAEEILIENCTITGNTKEGVRYQENGGLTNKVFRNCVIFGNNQGGVQFHHYYEVAPMTFENCLTLERDDAARYRYVDCILDKDPAFLAPMTGDYRLAPRSPCLDKGRNEPWMAGARDLAGFMRIYNGKVDLGCFEGKNPFLPTFLFIR